MRSRLLLVSIVLSLALLAACGGGSGSTPPGGDPQPLSCSLTGVAGSAEAATDWNWYTVQPAGTIPAVMLFVDFPDAPQSESTTALYDLLVPESTQWYQEVSYGKMALDITPIAKWYRMPKNSGDYGFNSLTWQKHRAYVQDAVALADADVDFTKYKIVYIAAASGANIPVSPTMLVNAGDGVFVDGTEVRFAVTFGADIRNTIPHYASNVLVHETGHVFSLPDLYLYNTTDFLRPVGGWDVMSATLTGAHFLAWHKNKLGWLDASQIHCVSLPGTVEETITPIETTGGMKAIVIPISTTKAYVAEVRQPVGIDARLCDNGVLVYTADSTVASGQGPVQVQPAVSGGDASQLSRCGAKYNATFDVGLGQASTFQDVQAGLKIEVLSETSGFYKVRVTNSRK